MGDQPLCFVLMPFGKKPDPAGGAEIDFNVIYKTAIEPGIRDAGLTPIRADEEELGGIIHQTMYERLLVCDFAVADLTTSNPNVLYELGIRHAARSRSTLAVYAARKPLPFDVAMMRAESYELGEGNNLPDTHAELLRQRVRDRLHELRRLAREGGPPDSPLFQLVPGWAPRPLALKEAAASQARLRANEEVKQQLSEVKAVSNVEELKPQNAAALAAIRTQVLASEITDADVLTALMLGYRALSDWTGMIEVHDLLPELLQEQVTVRQLLAFAYSRRAEDEHDPADRQRALQVLVQLPREQDLISETSGMIGRIYMSQWEEARARGEIIKARGHLKKAIAAYVEGYEADLRDPYPGINAVTLLEVLGDEAAIERKRRLLPMVRLATEQRLRDRAPDYLDYATLLEIAVLENDPEQARDALDFAVAASPETWQQRTTAGNLRIIRQARKERGDDVGWLNKIINELDPPAGEPGIMTGPVPAASRIFISYRQDDARYAAGWLFDQLAAHFGDGQVFKDVYSIRPGDDFVDEITAAVGSCTVLLAVIGTQWLTVTNGEGQRRLDDPADFVRLEIEAAFARDVRVIPVLLDGARMPGAAELPASLAPLVRRQALELSHNHFHSVTDYLKNLLDTAIAKAGRPAAPLAGS
jgi:hypothetical protein